MLSKVDIGVVHGRFQVFHLKHMEYILAAKMRCKKLIIGMEEPDRLSMKRENPFTFYERFEMIQEALMDFGVVREEFDIVPLPMKYPERILNYVPKEAVYYLNICDEEDMRMLELFEKLHLQTEVLMRKTPDKKGITGAEIRRSIALGEEWRQFVPKTVYDYIISRGLENRIFENEKQETYLDFLRI